ncbi:MAG: NAD-dependent epimerase/dehydratase family protein, partial [Candidatus Omnitrophica bacterium]|nr:NAD-dependent epimerase/dehydratase family protein [Candidatus Omnitrophota bacterium]
AQVPGPFDWVVNTVSAGGGGVAEYREVYWKGTRHSIEWLEPTPLAKYVYTSSPGAYGQTESLEVNETSPTVPDTETGQVLLDTENLLLAAQRKSGFPAVILRVAGIYGPGRGYWFRQYSSGRAVIEGDGNRILNMIHREGHRFVILAALEKGVPGEIYNAVDDEPVTQRAYFQWLSERLGKAMPPSVPQITLSGRNRGRSNKRVLNAKLKAALDYAFKYATFRQGCAAEIARLVETGALPRAG